MSSRRSPAAFAYPILAALAAAGAWLALTRGGLDYDVFVAAARWVSGGQPERIYAESPDRYLYAPAFAWLFAPFAWIPRDAGLLAWTLAKALALGFALKRLAARIPEAPPFAFGAALLVVARPLLIDFQYGQLNLLLLALALWVASEPESPRESFVAWLGLTLLAWAKLFPIPLLLLPWLRGTSRQRVAVLLGSVIVLGLPFLALGLKGGGDLYEGWSQAIAARGLPLESHNQSLAAWLARALGGTSVHVIFAGPAPIPFGMEWLSRATIERLALAWSLLAASLWLARAVSLPRGRATFRDWALLIGVLLLPLHLVWKPYFLFGLPLMLVLASGWKSETPARRAALVLLGILYNFTGFDFVGAPLAAFLEASSLFFWLHLASIGLVVTQPSVDASDRAI